LTLKFSARLLTAYFYNFFLCVFFVTLFFVKNMFKFCTLLYFCSFLSAGFSQQIHCGYDFTSYFVVEPMEINNGDIIKGLDVCLVDFFGNPLVNKDNKYSWTKPNEVMTFYENYKINEQGKRNSTDQENGKWYFYFAKESYLISVNNEFKAEQFKIKIEDPKGVYKTTFVPLNSFNMYILCTAEANVAKFGRRTNQPIKVILEKM